MNISTDTRPLLQTAARTAEHLIAAISPEQRSLPTPCGSFSVQELVEHQLVVLARVAAVGRGLDPMTVAHGPSGAEVGRGDLVAAWQVAVADAERAWADGAALRRTIVFPWVTQSGAATLIMWACELTTHTWDLSQATGVPVDWNDAVVQASLGSLVAILPDPNRASTFESVREHMPPEFRDFPPPYADAAPVALDAPLIDRLVAWSGRRP